MEQLKQALESAIAGAINELNASGLQLDMNIQLERPRDESHGQFSTNYALTHAKQASMNPRELANTMISALKQSPVIEKCEVAGPGFINFFLTDFALIAGISSIVNPADDTVANESLGRVLIESVSINPTGPLHVGHGRGASYGSALAEIMQRAGYEVTREYYLNDAGRQMDILTVSTYLRYAALFGQVSEQFEGLYQGEYLVRLAKELKQQYAERFVVDAALTASLAEDQEARIDMLVQRLKEALGEAEYRVLLDLVLADQQGGIEAELKCFRTEFDNWFSERSLHPQAVENAVNELIERGEICERDGALWLNTTQFGDDKDRVVRRANGVYTYFASDLAYIRNKYERGFDRIIYVLGADHHGYVKRLEAAARCFGYPLEKLEIIIIQFANLIEDGEAKKMSTRRAQFVTLEDLYRDVGVDSTRYFYLQRSINQTLDFDVSLAKSKSNDNPVYYIQYAHARICSVMRQAEKDGIDWNNADLTPLSGQKEMRLASEIQRLNEVISLSAQNRAPHTIAHYAREVAGLFHGWYTDNPILKAEPALRNARLMLAQATAITLQQALALLKIEAPEKM